MTTGTLPRGSPLGQRNFSIKGYNFVSQNPDVISPGDFDRSINRYLPALLAFWIALERQTGFRWKCTSYIRNSPTHRKGQAIDLAPDWTAQAAPYYATNQGSDPVLYKREWLIRRLQALKNTSLPNGMKIGVFIEPDHLHVQVIKPEEYLPNVSTVKWEIPKPVYGDTYERMALPIFRSY